MRLRLVYAVAATTAGVFSVPVVSPPVGEPAGNAVHAREAIWMNDVAPVEAVGTATAPGDTVKAMLPPTDAGRQPDREMRCAGSTDPFEVGAGPVVVGAGCRDFDGRDTSSMAADASAEINADPDMAGPAPTADPVPPQLPALFGAAVLGAAAGEPALCGSDICLAPAGPIEPTTPAGPAPAVTLPIAGTDLPLDELSASIPTAGTARPGLAADFGDAPFGDDKQGDGERSFEPPTSVSEPPTALMLALALIVAVRRRRRPGALRQRRPEGGTPARAAPSTWRRPQAPSSRSARRPSEASCSAAAFRAASEAQAP